eukprot:6492069-Amphidinium_carterae.1
MSASLSHALQPYECARLDGSGAEGVHRDVQLCLNRASASKFMYWAANLRLKQNIELWNHLKQNSDSILTQRFLSVFSEPARVLANCWTYPSLPRPVKLRRKDVLAKFYRMWPHNMVDWSDLIVKDAPRASVRAQLNDMSYCTFDLFRWAFQPGRTFSYIDPVAGPAPPDGSPDRSDWLLSHTLVFRVVTPDISKKKVQHKEHVDKVLPLFVQYFSVHPAHSTIGQELCVQTSGEPVAVDGAALLHPREFRKATQWMEVHAFHGGANRDILAQPQAIRPSLHDASTPLFFFMKALRQDGTWRAAQIAPRFHTIESEKHFMTPGWSKRKHYIRCLVNLPEILQRLDRMSSTQHERYYECVLAGHNPGLNLRARDYDAILGKAALVDANNDDAEGDGWNDDAWLGMLPDEEAEEGGNEEGAEIEPLEPLGAEEAAVDALMVDAEPVPDIPPSIDGLPLSVDVHAGYRRLMILCPCTHSTHKDKFQCRKYRNLGAAQTRELGNPNEVIAYLAAWARLAPECSTRQQHVNRNPSRQQLLTVAREKQWIQ